MKKNLLFILSIAFCSLNGAAQTQIGLDIDGEAGGDEFGRSVSMPDAYTVAVGASKNDGTASNAGQVQVHTWDGTAWVQKGADIDGEASTDFFGFSVSMPDSNTVAAGAYQNDGTGSNAGHARVYTWNGAAWVQKGADIDGEAAGDEFGRSISMGDSNTVAVGGMKNDGTGSNAGHARVYRWNGTAWVQKGADIDGEAAGDQAGFSISMPDSNTVAIGANLNDGIGADAGHARIYRWNGSAWVQKGADIDGETIGDQSGIAISMPDSNTVAIGANYGVDINGDNPGHARIFSWNGTSWVQKGLDIDGEADGDLFGRSLSMGDSNSLVVGGLFNDGNGNAAGHARAYKWSGGAWNQVGVEIDGEAAGDRFGTVSMGDPNTVAISGYLNGGTGSNAGHVQLYSFCTVDSVTDVQTACDSLTWIDGITYTTSNDTATFILTNLAGCDSVVTLDLTVNSSTTGSQTEIACESYTWSVNNETYTTTGAYTDTLTNAGGCDSVVTLNLTVNASSTGTSQTETACDSYTWPINNETYALTGSYTDTLTNAVGCDSVVTLNLTINNSSTGSQTETACGSYTWSADSQTYTSSGVYAATLTNSAGCDSVVTLNLTVDPLPDAGTSLVGTTITATEVGVTYQWIDCDNGNEAIANETSQSFTATANGNYAVELTLNGCVDTSSCVAITTVGLAENDFGNSLVVYPNPARDRVTIKSNAYFGADTEYVLINAQGQQIYRGAIPSGEKSMELNLDGLTQGVYSLKIIGEEKSKTVSIILM